MKEMLSEYHVVIGWVKDGAALGARWRFSFCGLYWKDAGTIIQQLVTRLNCNKCL